MSVDLASKLRLFKRTPEQSIGNTQGRAQATKKKKDEKRREEKKREEKRVRRKERASRVRVSAVVSQQATASKCKE